MQLARHLPAQADQQRFRTERGAHRRQLRRASPEQVRAQRDGGRQEGRDRRECATKTADRVRQLVTVGKQVPGCRPAGRSGTGVLRP